VGEGSGSRTDLTDLTHQGVVDVVGADAGFADGVLGEAVDGDLGGGVGGVGVEGGLGDGLGVAVNEGAGEGGIAKNIEGDGLASLAARCVETGQAGALDGVGDRRSGVVVGVEDRGGDLPVI
jgi:hypothetical protein